jgi:uncharacterized phage protein (TIGR01671 family)
MKEIKFRAYQKSKNYIYKVLDINFEGHNQTIREVKLSNGDIVTSNRIDDLVLMQYTGLKDKNGVEIYEGDIVNTTNLFIKTGIVAYYINSFEIEDILEEKFVIKYPKWNEIEVIGNIYENE